MEQYTQFIGNHLLLTMSFFGLLAYWISGEIRARTSGVGSVSPMDATQLMNHEHAVVIDVRENKEMETGRILNAVHIPSSDIHNQLGKLEKYKQKPVIVACRSGHRSNGVCNMLRKNGFEKVYNLRGGMIAWQKDSLPLVK